ncbi:nicotinate-nucleotide adenylyltransferase [Caloramator fervidus]|uniref:Probable nicotinate-nucleotide adenylyltransferase n=1 Tax=Caloramator fervidus TaxID=29344 RepID=A0A1H5VQM7_9CLOT|nr:nicotinate-nucleotide adenylyltransferase [Caloramator fervidus]SEF89316.1 nicotinate-nucleotide adenylyltransferase [Caloramator fervidus]
MNVGIFGGTFNPIHYGHLIVANEVLDNFKLEKIIFIPCGIPPHKREDIAAARLRYEMVKLAIEDNPFFEVIDIEVKKDNYSYTYDTLIELQKIYSVNKFKFIIGLDAFLEIDSWKNVYDVFKMAEFIVVNRDENLENVKKIILEKATKYKGEVKFLRIPNIEISSSEIRKRIRLGKSIRYLLPDKVIDFIQKNKIYKGEG